MWIESHTNLARHPKTRRLMKLLGWSLPDTIGNLHLFWYWALDFAPTGDLSRYTPEQLTADLDLLGVSPEQFIEAMVQAGFLDRIADTLSIHDWFDYKRPKPRRRSGGMPAPRERDASSGASRNDQMVEHGSQGAIRVDCVEDAARTGEVSGSERSQPTLRAVRRTFSSATAEPKSNIGVVQPDPDFTPTDSAASEDEVDDSQIVTQSPVPAQSERDTALPEESPRPAIAEQFPLVVAPQPEPRTAAEELELRKAFPANLWRLPGFTKHWWPLHIDFHKKAGTPLTKDAQAKFLAQLARDPLSAVQQIKQAITHTVRSGILEHAP